MWRRLRLAPALFGALFAALGGCASNASDPESKGRIKDAFARLGAEDARGDCLARGVTSRLSTADEREAARIVESSRSKEEMKDSVLGAKSAIQRAFVSANMSCSLLG